MKKQIFLIVLLISIVFISLCAQKEQPLSPGGGGGGGPPSCSSYLNLKIAGMDTCTITATITASYCDNKSYEIKNGGSKCSGAISSNSFTKECSWDITYGTHTYSLYIDSNFRTSKTVNCPETPKTCSDGTEYNKCSSNKPKYCDNGNLINKCTVCVCPTNQICNITIEECYTPNECSGSISFSLNPSTIEPNDLVTPSASGLSGCDNKITYFRKDSCSGIQISSCTLINGGCTGSSFNAPSAEGLYTYYACIDKNGDNDFGDSGESSSRILNVTIINDPTPPLLQNEIIHLDNSLEYLRASELGVHDMAEYVISKSYLGTQIPNKTQIIDYFDNNQNQTDGSWKDVNTPMFTTHRILLAYYILNVTPNRSLDSFFSNYDTWEEALAYDKSIHGTFDGRDIYHIVIGWVLYYRTYPPWLNDFFTNIEKDLTWTNSTNSHKRTHILYSYVIARRQFPNLDGIINETLKEQSPDGHWDYQCLSTPRPVYCNAIQLVLLQQIIKLYPNHRTAEIQNSIDKSRQWVYDTYNTTTINGVVMGYFGTAINIEDSLMTGIMSAGINGLMDINVDMTFEDIVPKT